MERGCLYQRTAPVIIALWCEVTVSSLQSSVLQSLDHINVEFSDVEPVDVLAV